MGRLGHSGLSCPVLRIHKHLLGPSRALHSAHGSPVFLHSIPRANLWGSSYFPFLHMRIQRLAQGHSESKQAGIRTQRVWCQSPCSFSWTGPPISPSRKSNRPERRGFFHPHPKRLCSRLWISRIFLGLVVCLPSYPPAPVHFSPQMLDSMQPRVLGSDPF